MSKLLHALISHFHDNSVKYVHLLFTLSLQGMKSFRVNATITQCFFMRTKLHIMTATDHVSMNLDSLASHRDEKDRCNRQGCG